LPAITGDTYGRLPEGVFRMANVFKDTQGREYTVMIDGYVLHRARSLGKLSLTSMFVSDQENQGGKMPLDPVLLIELCYYGCEHSSRIRAGKVSKEQFLRNLVGKSLTDAIQATAEALKDCLAPSPGEEETPDTEGVDGEGPLGQ